MIPEDPIRIQEIPKEIQNLQTGRCPKERETRKEKGPRDWKSSNAIPRRPKGIKNRSGTKEIPKETSEENQRTKAGIPR
jgi:hypothetical protein